VGYMLETVHLQASAMDDDFKIHQHNQAPIDVLNAAYQHITPMIRSAATRNRTKRAEGTRDECVGLTEIDEHATRGKTKKLERNDLMILNMERTCSTWNKTAAYHAGQSETKACELCGKDEKAAHFWTCASLEGIRKEADPEIANLDPEALPAALKQGIAPAMTADITKTFWGKEPSSKDDADTKALCGCKPEREVSTAMRKIINVCDARITAREVMQNLLHDEKQEDLPLPEWVANKTPPKDPNVYGDGSLKHPGVGPHWMVGGLGVWWPGRKPGDIEESITEEWYTKTQLRRGRVSSMGRIQQSTQ
jgi:hypothetical protein